MALQADKTNVTNMSVNCFHAWKSGHITCLGLPPKKIPWWHLPLWHRRVLPSVLQCCSALKSLLTYFGKEQTNASLVNVDYSTLMTTLYLLLCILVIAWTGQWIATVSFDTEFFFPFKGEFKTIKHSKFQSDHQHILSTRLWGHFKQSYLKKQLV